MFTVPMRKAIYARAAAQECTGVLSTTLAHPSRTNATLSATFFALRMAPAFREPAAMHMRLLRVEAGRDPHSKSVSIIPQLCGGQDPR